MNHCFFSLKISLHPLLLILNKVYQLHLSSLTNVNTSSVEAKCCAFPQGAVGVNSMTCLTCLNSQFDYISSNCKSFFKKSCCNFISVLYT